MTDRNSILIVADESAEQCFLVGILRWFTWSFLVILVLKYLTVSLRQKSFIPALGRKRLGDLCDLPGQSGHKK